MEFSQKMRAPFGKHLPQTLLPKRFDKLSIAIMLFVSTKKRHIYQISL